MQDTNVALNAGTEEFYYNDEDLFVINESFKTKLSIEHRHNLTKLFNKLTVAPVGEVFATPFNSEKTLITYAKLDYMRSGIAVDRNVAPWHAMAAASRRYKGCW